MRVLLAIILNVAWLPMLSAADIYDNPQNLKVLPEGTSAGELRNTMRNFALSTGLRCFSCHVGEEGQPLETYDFASDEKELKGKARVMMQMVGRINTSLSAEIGDPHVEVNCVTCHRGVSKPKMLGTVLAEAAEEGGAQALKDKYAALREQYHGTHSYDFSEFTMTEIARQRLGAGHPDQAYAVLDIVLAENPDSFQGHFFYGELALRQGNKALAREHYARALEINPQAAGFVQPRLDQAKE